MLLALRAPREPLVRLQAPPVIRGQQALLGQRPQLRDPLVLRERQEPIQPSRGLRVQQEPTLQLQAPLDPKVPQVQPERIASSQDLLVQQVLADLKAG